MPRIATPFSAARSPTATTTSAKDKDGDNDAGNEAAEKSGKIDIKG